MTTEQPTTLAQIAAELRPDYDAAAAGSDLMMMAQMQMVGRDELAITCLNRVQAYLWKLDQAAARVAPLILHKPECVECGRVFDLFNSTDAAEWSAGHDCIA